MAHEIDLGGGFIARIDDEDVPLVAGRIWRAARNHRAVYAVAGSSRNLELMHRLILGATGSEKVDHVSGDGLDNRKHNLRKCSQAENSRNRGKWSECTSPFKGVGAEADRVLWRTTIRAGGMRMRLGAFESEHAAARAYDRAARLVHGKFAKTNEMLGFYTKHPDRIRAA